MDDKVHPRSVLLCGLVCLSVLMGMLVRHAWPLWFGREVYLRVQPVDPRDLFRGDYVILGYPMQRLWLSAPAVEGPGGGGQVVKTVGAGWDEPLPRDAAVYVQLEPRANPETGEPHEFHEAVSVSRKPLAGSINLAGRVVYHSGGALSLRYPIDAYYVQAGTGRDIEQAIRTRKPVYAQVMVSGSGAARVKGLIVEGRRVNPPGY